MAVDNDSIDIPSDAWPTFQVPAGIPTDGTAAGSPPTPPAAPATPPDAAGGTPPAQPAAAAPPPAAPPGGGTGQPSDAEGSVPKYRLDDQRERFEQIVQTQQAQIDRLSQLLERALSGQPAQPAAPAAPPEPPSPQDLAIRERLMKVVPELALLERLKPIVERSNEVLGAADVVPRWLESEQTFYDRYAESAVNSVYDRVAKLTFGEDKTADALDEFARDQLLSTFTRWVTRDPKRAARFEAQDPKVVDEFISAYKASVYDPVRRDRNAALQQRVETPPAIPQGGGSTPPAPVTPQPINYADEDSVHAAAWAARDTVGTR